MNRVRDITNSDPKSKELVKYLNLLYDMMDVKVFYTELGGKDIDVSNALEGLEESIIEQHSEFLKKEMPAMLRDPMYKPYTERLLNEYKAIGLVDETEAKIFEGELRLQRFEEELKDQKKKKVRNLGGMTKIGLGIDKNLIASKMDYTNVNLRDSIDLLMIFKSDPDKLMQNNTEKDSMTLIETRQMLQRELQKLKLQMTKEDERQFLIDKFGADLNLNLDTLVIRPLEGGANTTAGAGGTAKPGAAAAGTSPDKPAEETGGKPKLSLAERRAQRLAEKKEKAALEQDKKKDEKKDDKKKDADKSVKKDADKEDKKKDEKKDDKKKDEKKTDKAKDDKKKDEKKKDDKKDDKKKDDKKKDDKKKDDKKKDDKEKKKK